MLQGGSADASGYLQACIVCRFSADVRRCCSPIFLRMHHLYDSFIYRIYLIKKPNMTKTFKLAVLATAWIVGLGSCKKSNSQTNNATSPVVGFWTYEEDPANDYWNDNVLFKSDGTFRMYTALSLADTVAAQALADTANQVVTFGTYTVK